MKCKCVLSIAFGCLLNLETSNAQNTNDVPSDQYLEKARVKPIGNWQVDPAETQELNQDYAAAIAAANSIAPGPDWGAKRQAVDNVLRQQLESFLLDHPSSAYAPSLHATLAQRAQLRCGYSLAMEHYSKAVSMLAGSPDPTAQKILLEAGGGLAKLLAMTGQLGELDNLVALVAQPGTEIIPGSKWTWAREMRAYVLKHPEESFKCGLYCLDMLGRTTQSGQFLPKNVTETPSSTNGFTAADLVAVATRAGLRVHAAPSQIRTTFPRRVCFTCVASTSYLLARSAEVFMKSGTLLLLGRAGLRRMTLWPKRVGAFWASTEHNHRYGRYYLANPLRLKCRRHSHGTSNALRNYAFLHIRPVEQLRRVRSHA